MQKLVSLKNQVLAILNPAADFVALLPIRLLMAYEFGSAGFKKLEGTNWFGRVQENFLFPFNHIPVEISWFMRPGLKFWVALRCFSDYSPASGRSVSSLCRSLRFRVCTGRMTGAACRNCGKDTLSQTRASAIIDCRCCS